jgi:hypothetical protein
MGRLRPENITALVRKSAAFQTVDECLTAVAIARGIDRYTPRLWCGLSRSSGLLLS